MTIAGPAEAIGLCLMTYQLMPWPMTCSDFCKRLLSILGNVGSSGTPSAVLIGLEIALRFGLRKLVIVNGWSEIDPHTERCFDARLALLRNSGPEAFVRAQPIFLFPANWIAANEALLAEEAATQLDHFPGISTIERRIAAARDFKLWLDMPDADILALAAEDDMLVPSLRSKALVKSLCSMPKLAMMKWGGHACNVTDPGTFNRLVLKFLRS